MPTQTLTTEEHKWANDMARQLNLKFAEEGDEQQQGATEENSSVDPWEELASLEKAAEELFANDTIIKNQAMLFSSFKKAGKSARSNIAGAKKDLTGRKVQNAQAKLTKVRADVENMERLHAAARSNHASLEAQIPWMKEDHLRLASEMPIVDSLAIAKKIPSKKYKKFVGLNQEVTSLIKQAESHCQNFQVDAGNKVMKSLHNMLKEFQKEVNWLQTLPDVSGVGTSKEPKPSRLDKLADFFKKKEKESKVELGKSEASEKTKVFIKSWQRENFTDPAKRKDLQKRGGASAPFKFVVHTGSMDDLINQTGCFAPDANKAMKGWDTICTSVVTDEKCFAYGAFGVILDVPPENVLVSSPDDLMSELNIGRDDRKDYMVNVTKEQNERNLAVPKHVKDGYLQKHLSKFDYDKRQQPVDNLIENTYYQHNEVIVSTKEDVQHKQGVDATGELKIQGIFMIDSEPSPDVVALHEFDGKHALTKEEKYQLFMQHAEKVSKSLGVPVLFLNGESTTA